MVQHVDFDPGQGPQTNANIVRQGFSADEYQMQAETSALAIAAAARAAIESRYVLALKRPRDWDMTRDKLLKECKRPGFAESAIYKKPVGSKKNEETGQWEKAYVEGLSVRFAEAALRYMTNVYSEATSIYDDPGKLIMRVTVTDVESNTSFATDVTVQKTVERRNLKRGQRAIRERVNSNGDRVFIVEATDDDVLNKTNALVSKALRNGVSRLLPGDIQDECEDMCRRTQRAKDAENPDAARRKILDSFSSIGVTPEMVKGYLGHNGDTLQPAELTDLRAIYAAIRDGETTWAAVIDEKPAAAAQPKDGDPAASTDAKADAAAPAKSAQDIVEQHKKKQAEKTAPKADDATPSNNEAAADERAHSGK
jgi:hypothetical protein